jgi:hypothetical protein
MIVELEHGVFSVFLGDESTGQQPPLELDFDQDYWIEIEIDGSATSPRQQFASVGYAFTAARADTALFAHYAGASADTAMYAMDADKVDGQHASDFAAAEHDHDSEYVNEGQTNSVTSGMIVDGTIQEADLGFTVPDGHSLDAADGSPTDAAYVSSVGHLGIGTTDPATQLHVNSGEGNTVATFESTDPGAAIVLKDINTTADNTGLVVSDGDLRFRTGNTSRLAIDSDGNVGIGTTTPAERLEVIGAIKTQGFQMSTGADSGYVLMSDRWGNGSWQPGGSGAGDSDWYVNGDNMYAIPSGNVGIGTTDPLWRFHVADSGDGVLVSAGTSADNEGFKVNNAANTATYFSVRGDGDITVPTGQVGIGVPFPEEKLEVNGKIKTSQFQMPTGAGDSYYLTSDASGNASWTEQSPGTDDGDWTISGNDVYRDIGNVGIGTTNPSMPLHVNSGTGNTAALFESDDSGVVLAFQDNETSSSPQMQVQGDDLMFRTSGANRVYVTGTGEVGIGTTMPTERFHVNSETENITAVFESSDPTTAISLRDNETTSSPQIQAQGDDLMFRTSGANRMYITSGGQVGIGTTTPSRPLEIDIGSAEFGIRVESSNPVQYQGLDVYNTARTADTESAVRFRFDSGGSISTSWLKGINVGGDSDFRNELEFSVMAAGGYEVKAVRIDSDGEVGIGTTSPSRPLDVRGEIIAVYGEATATSGATYGVRGVSNSASGWGVYYTGGLGGTGAKSCVVKTSQGPTLLYCQESTENWFEEFGEGQLYNGRCHIELDPLFLETVTIDASNPMKVFVQLGGDCRGVFVRKGVTGFSVIELQGGNASIPFDYRVVAKRKGFEAKRLDYCTAAETDPYLYPGLQNQ